jgi:aspartate kinase
MKQLVVMKFGGTSVGSAERIKDVAAIVHEASEKYRVAVVVSAMSGVTDMLVRAAESAESKNKAAYQRAIEEIRSKHHEAIEALGLSLDESQALISTIEQQLVDLSDWLEGVYMLRELTPKARDLITSFGERLSIHLVAAALKNTNTFSKAVSAASCIVTDESFGDAQPNLAASTTHSRSHSETPDRRRHCPCHYRFFGRNPQRHNQHPWPRWFRLLGHYCRLLSRCGRSLDLD